MPRYLHSNTLTCQFHGGPLDGLQIELPEGIEAPAEITWRDKTPPRELVYAKRPVGNVLTAAALSGKERNFDLVES